MASLITKNTMIDTFNNPDYIKIYLFNSEYIIPYNTNTIQLIKGKGVNNIWKYKAIHMASHIALQRYKVLNK